MAMSFNEAPVNTLPDVTMIMIKYKNYEGDIEIIKLNWNPRFQFAKVNPCS